MDQASHVNAAQISIRQKLEFGVLMDCCVEFPKHQQSTCQWLLIERDWMNTQ